MARDPLRLLLSVRHRSVEQARAALGTCLRAEAEVAGALRQLEEADRRHRETQASWEEAHQFAEMAARRAEASRTDRLNGLAALAEAEARSASARDAVTAARLAARAVEQLITERDAASRAEAALREQHVLDDIARAGGPQRRGRT